MYYNNIIYTIRVSVIKQVVYSNQSKCKHDNKKHHMMFEMNKDTRLQGPPSNFDASVLESLNKKEKTWWQFSNKQDGDSIFTFHVCYNFTL